MAIYPGAAYKPLSRNFYRWRTANRGLVLHVQEGNNSLFGWFSNPMSEASSEFWCAKDGRIEQYLDPDSQSGWTQGTGNGSWCAVETEGYAGEPFTEAQIEALAKLYRWGHETYGWPYRLTDDPDGSGLGWHGMGAAAGVPSWGHPDCPGDLRLGARGRILGLAAGITTTSKEDDMPLSQQDKDSVVAGVLTTRLETNAGKLNLAELTTETLVATREMLGHSRTMADSSKEMLSNSRETLAAMRKLLEIAERLERRLDQAPTPGVDGVANLRIQLNGQDLGVIK